MILLSGGSGILGQELQKLLKVYAPTHEELDVTNREQIKDFIQAKGDIELIIHAAAYTNVNMAEKELEKCYLTNVIGTRNIVLPGIPVVYISTDSIFSGDNGNYKESDIPYPKNFYSFTKYLGELEIKTGWIIRICSKTKPWAHEVACTDRFFSAFYVDDAAREIAYAVKIRESLPRVLHIGSGRKSHYNFARITKPSVKPIEIKEYEVYRGKDWSLNSELWESLR